jgi:hypothetical protein
MEQNKKPVGRPRVETYLDPQWYDIILESGRNGLHITDFLIKLGISWETHYELLKRNKKYSEAFKEYNKLCENWFYTKAHEALQSGESNKFNQRLWTIMVKNKFKENWRDEKVLDVHTMGEKIKEDNPIKIEIIRKEIDGTEEIN